MKYKKPKCKRKKNRVQVIKPLRKHCIKCGGKLEDHHLTCSLCHSKRDRERYWKLHKNNKNGGIILQKIEVGV
jgi:hypothetical protein